MRPAHGRARLGAGRRPRARVRRCRHGRRPGSAGRPLTMRLRWARRAGSVRRRGAVAVTIETIRGSAVAPVPRTLPHVAERIGIDVEPLDLRDDRLRTWLAACIAQEIGAVTRQECQRVLRGGAAPPAAGGDRRGRRVAGSRLDLDRSAGADEERGDAYRPRPPGAARFRRAYRRAGVFGVIQPPLVREGRRSDALLGIVRSGAAGTSGSASRSTAFSGCESVRLGM